ncbi:MAG: AlpA family phage regulatory protein [Magnetococcales bacterium]|nr:AlpA family phage regulatory protein [Magnetococcales bacterium]
MSQLSATGQLLRLDQIAENKFPKPLKVLGARSSRWWDNEIKDWINACDPGHAAPNAEGDEQ